LPRPYIAVFRARQVLHGEILGAVRAKLPPHMIAYQGGGENPYSSPFPDNKQCTDYITMVNSELVMT